MKIITKKDQKKNAQNSDNIYYIKWKFLTTLTGYTALARSVYITHEDTFVILLFQVLKKMVSKSK